MITNTEQTLVISTDYCNGPFFWVYDIRARRVRLVTHGPGGRFQIVQGSDNYFLVVYFINKAISRITLRNFRKLDQVIAQIEVKDECGQLPDSLSWKHVPSQFDTDECSVYLFPDKGNWEIRRLPWIEDSSWFYDGPDYDVMYQGIGPAARIPGRRNVFIPIFRDTRVVVYDVLARRVIDKVDVGGCFGCSAVRFCKKENEIWVLNYDSLARINIDTLKVIASQRIQHEVGGVGAFIGLWNFDLTESLCVIPRPYSGDVVVIDVKAFSIVDVCPIGGRPYEGILLDSGEIVSREMKSGDLLLGRRSN